jgi:hypothetical protein
LFIYVYCYTRARKKLAEELAGTEWLAGHINFSSPALNCIVKQAEKLAGKLSVFRDQRQRQKLEAS